MNLDELQSVQARERQTDSLQQLRASFYEDAAAFVERLREERERAADHAEDPFDDPDVNRLTDDITTAERTIEAIYERRVGKVVKMASLAAAEMPTEEDGLTTEERDLFETLVGAIEDNRQRVLDAIAGEAPAGTVTGDRPDDADAAATSVAGAAGGPGSGPDEDGAPADASESGRSGAMDDGETQDDAARPPSDGDGTTDTAPTDAAAAMGAPDAAEGTGTRSAGSDEDASPAPAPPDATQRSDETQGPDGATASPPSTGDAPASPAAPPSDGGEGADDEVTGASSSDVERTTVRITQDVGAILGVDDREYDLAESDVVTLPTTNAEPLLERDAAERLE